MSRYVITPKRARRSAIPQGWQGLLKSVSGLTVVGDDQSRYLQVDANEGAIRAVREEWGDRLHIEEAVAHQRLLGPAV